MKSEFFLVKIFKLWTRPKIGRFSAENGPKIGRLSAENGPKTNEIFFYKMSHNFAQIRPEIRRKSAVFGPEKSPRAFGLFGLGFGRAGPGKNGLGGRPDPSLMEMRNGKFYM